MSNEVNAIPEGYEGVTPYLICKNAEKAIEFYTRAFGAEELFRIEEPGMVGHAEMKIGNAIFMMADESAQMDIKSPESYGGTPVHLMVYVPDIDAFTEKALAEGATELEAITDKFYGDRSCKVQDPYGHIWSFATHVEDVSPEEMNERAAAMYGG